MMEILGKMPRKVATGGSRSKDYFDRHGDLKRIRRLKSFPLDRILVEKYKFSKTDAHDFSDFLSPVFNFEPEKRPTAAQCLKHPWLKYKPPPAPVVEKKEEVEKEVEEEEEVEVEEEVKVKVEVEKFGISVSKLRARFMGQTDIQKC